MSLTLATSAIAAGAAERGYFGLAVSVDADGFFNPTLKAVTVSKVTPRSPAAKAGVEVGDLIVEVEGQTVAGLKADDLKPFMQLNIGEATRFVMKRSSGEVVLRVLVAAPKAD